MYPVQAGDNGFNRSVFNIKGVHILRGLHSADKSAFDHVAAEYTQLITVSQSISICRSCFSGVVIHVSVQYNGTGDILVLERRYEFPLTLSSHARSILDLRPVREITGLCSLIGMESSDVEAAFSGVDIITAPPNPAVKVIG